MKKKLLINLFSFLIIGGMYAQPGEIDKTFNAIIGAGASGAVKSVIEQADGKIIVAGEFTSYDYKSKNRIMRLNADGTLDSSFDIGTGANGNISSIALQSDGKILIIGGFTAFNGITKNKIARLNTDGTVDASFIPATGLNSCSSFVVQANGNILVAGTYTASNGFGATKIVRLEPDGALDTTFDNGTGPNGGVTKLAIQSDGKIIIVGYFSSYNGMTSKNIARLNTDGTLDTSFYSGNGAYGIEAVAIQADGKILIGGYFSAYNFTPRSCLARLNPNGTLDNTFNMGTGTNSTIESIAIQSDGKILIGGVFTTYNGSAKNSIARLNTDGTLDNSFDSGTGANESISSIAIKTDGKIVIGGRFTSYNNTLIGRLAQLNADGKLDTSFLNPGGFGSGSTQSISCMALQSDGKTLITGEYVNSYNGIATKRLVRVNADGTLDTSFNTGTGPSSSVYAITTQSDGKILIGGRFANYNGVSRNGIARINTDGTLDTSFNIGTGLNNSIYSIAVQTDGKILISGLFTTFNGITRNRFARLNIDGTLDTTFDPGTGPDNVIYSIVLQKDGKIIIAGNFKKYNGTSKECIARLNINGTIDTTFNLGISVQWSVDVVKIQSDGKLLISGTFVGYTGVNSPPPGLARLNADGSLDPTFVAKSMFFTNTGTNPYTNPSSMEIQSDGKIIIGGTITSYGGTPILNIARLNTDGTLDTSFIAGTGTANNQGISSGVDNIIIQPDGKILISGVFILYNGVTVGRIARILPGELTALSTEEFIKQSLTVYPNPSSGIFNISSNQNIENASIKVFDLNGRIIHQSRKISENKVLDLTHSQNGIYILNIENEGYNYAQKIIKQ
ncbi:T9SS type A sorting domain-containing protein [Flavobacterium eburneipallidum]|uniref:T9SS type A sorting domain-containing protein n=1 Tax=Flavobacterium eburneipallidum TaxID=3003263 RepID=UPI0024826A73|nr:T9SS type A sorting domain-containing protein [Flavobacterium eburneipallidum]